MWDKMSDFGLGVESMIDSASQAMARKQLQEKQLQEKQLQAVERMLRDEAMAREKRGLEILAVKQLRVGNEGSVRTDGDRVDMDGEEGKKMEDEPEEKVIGNSPNSR